MRRTTIAILILFSFVHQKLAAQGRDTIILRNDQMLIGEVEDARLGVISIDDNELKLQRIKLYKIKVLIVHEKFKIETIDKNIYYSKIKFQDKDGWMTIQEDSGMKLTMPITDIFLLVSLDKSFANRVHGNLTAGFSFTKSNSIGQMNISANAGFATKHMEYGISLSGISSLDSGTFSRDNENVSLSASYDLTAAWFLTGIAQYQRNLELNIARRFIEIVGVGNKLFIRNTWQLTMVTGLDFTQQLSTEGISSPQQLEVPVVLRFNFFKFRNPDIQISTSQTGYFSLSDPGRIRYDGQTSFSWQMVRYFYLTISPYSNFDNKPPSGSSSHFDYGVVIGVTYKF